MTDFINTFIDKLLLLIGIVHQVLQQLGINQTFFFYVVIQVIAIFILGQFIFRPFSEALQKRLENTTSLEEVAVETKIETQQIAARFEVKARELSKKIKTIFDDYRAQGQKEAETVLSETRKKADTLLSQQKTRINADLEKAKTEVAKEVKALSGDITQKLMESSR